MNAYDPYNSKDASLPTTGDSDNALYLLLGLLAVGTAMALTKKHVLVNRSSVKSWMWFSDYI